MSVNTDATAIDSVLSLGVSDVIVREELEKKLKSGKKLRIKLGIDPTGFDLHLGHMVVIHKMKELQDLGHQIILLFGNFTGQIGDPTGKDTTRALLTQDELENNAKDYLKQASCILDVDKVEVRWNADWLAPLSFKDVVKLSSHFTVAQMLERDMFQERIKKNQPISMHEFMYPLMQGYDSVALEADVELGGTDQTFNLFAGRKLQAAYGQEGQNFITMPILVGTDGVIKMGKSTGNFIAVADTPEEMFGKMMSIPDKVMMDYFELAARFTEEELQELEKRMDGGENPRNLKMELAKAVIEIYHDAAAAEKGEAHFKQVFQKKEIPDDIEEVKLKGAKWLVIDLIAELGMAPSKSEARRLITGGAVKIEGEKVTDLADEVELTKEALLVQVGKRKFKRAAKK
jgi:tyrosyl-tRNA synthetase